MSAHSGSTPFLRAEWRHLAMLSYPIAPAVLEPLVPLGTQLDLWQGEAWVSVVAFLFLRTRLLGVSVPLHTDFEEVNLRFYVRREHPDGPRRGVVFVKEIVPRRAIAWTARALYNERYVALPMRHELQHGPNGAAWVQSAEYGWSDDGREERVRVVAAGPPAPLADGSHEQFIAEHYWGYSAQRDGGTVEYRVEHPPWRVAALRDCALECDVAALWGPQFAAALAGPPRSAFLAEGSEVAVHRGVRLET